MHSNTYIAKAYIQITEKVVPFLKKGINSLTLIIKYLHFPSKLERLVISLIYIYLNMSLHMKCEAFGAAVNNNYY